MVPTPGPAGNTHVNTMSTATMTFPFTVPRGHCHS